MKHILFLFFLIFLLHAKQDELNTTPNSTVIYSNYSYSMPFAGSDENGVLTGILAGYLKLLEQKTGLIFVHSGLPENETVNRSNSEVVVADMHNMKLQTSYKALEPFYNDSIVIVMNKDTHYVKDLNQLKGKTIAMIKDQEYTEKLYKYYPEIDFIEVNTIDEAMKKVSSNTIDALLAPKSSAMYVIKEAKIDNLRVVGQSDITIEMTLFIKKSNPELYILLDNILHSTTLEEHEAIVRSLSTQNALTWDSKMMVYSLLTVLVLLGLYISIFFIRIKKSKERYKRAIAATNDALWHWDIPNNGVFISSRFEEMLGHESVDVFQTFDQWKASIYFDDREAVEALIAQCKEDPINSYTIEFRMQHDDGSWHWIRMRVKSFYKKTKVAHIDGTCSDITSEKLLSRELYKSQQLLETIIDNIPIHVFWKDLNSRYLGCNRLFSQDISDDVKCNIVGLSDYDMPWKNEALGYIEDDQMVMRQAKAKLDYEEQQTNGKGEKVWLSTSKVPLIDENGEVFGVLGAYYDITERKNRQIQNEKKTQRLETAEGLSHIGSWEWNIVTGELTWSDEVYRIFGEEPQSFKATYERFVSYVLLEYHKGLEDAINSAIESKQPYEFDHEIRQKDGTIRLIREAGYVVYNSVGEAVLMYGTILDISAIIEARVVNDQNKELADLLKKFDENVVASNTDLKGTITYASKAFANISGYSVEELVGSSQSIVRHPDMPKELFKELWQTLRSGKVWKGEIKNLCKDGSSYWVFNTIAPILDKKGVCIGYSAIRHNITHEKEVEALHKTVEKKSLELENLNKNLEKRIDEAVLERKHKDHLMAQQSKLASMGEMVGNIAHQWRQPLNALGLLLQKQQIFYDKGILNSEKMHESVAKGVKLIEKMSTTIDDFRDFFKPNKEKTQFKIKEVVEDTLALIDAALYNKNITLKLDIEEVLSIYGYKNEFSQVIFNLVNNAKDAISEKSIEEGIITIRAFHNDTKVIIEVSDNAGGIPENIIDHVFEPYFTTKQEGQGTGIGLYMSKMIIESNMDGYFHVVNGDLGAVFTIEFNEKVALK